MLYANGGTVDDLLVYRLAEGRFMLVVNASNRMKDWAWVNENVLDGITLKDVSDDVSDLALQGPLAERILTRLTSQTIPAGNYTFVEQLVVADMPCLVSRTGYTGEDGFELYCSNNHVPRLWDALLDAGDSDGLIPCGLGARDTLRLEASMPLYGHELSETINPLEAGLGIFVKMDKPDFIGKQGLIEKPTRRRRGLRMTGRGIAREGCEVFAGDKKVGVVTSGTMLPFVGYAGAMALLDVGVKEDLEVDVRGRRIAAEIVRLPFYKRGSHAAPNSH